MKTCDSNVKSLKIPKNTAGIFRFSYVTDLLHVFIQQTVIENLFQVRNKSWTGYKQVLLFVAVVKQMQIESMSFKARPIILSMKLAGIRPPKLESNSNMISLIGFIPLTRLVLINTVGIWIMHQCSIQIVHKSEVRINFPSFSSISYCRNSGNYS